LLARLAMPISDNAILRQLKDHVRECADPAPLRAIGIDDWSLAIVVIVLPASKRTLISLNLASRAARAARCVERRWLSPSEMLREPFLAFGPVEPFASTSLCSFQRRSRVDQMPFDRLTEFCRR
jgi:hypothetical protein